MAIGEPDAVFTVEPIDPATTGPDNAPEPKPERRAEGHGQGQGSFPAQEAKAKPAPRRKQGQQGPKFLSATEVIALPVTGYLVDGLLPKRGVGQIYGDSGCGKSFTTMMLVHCLATGKTFCGRKTKPCSVYYFHLEGAGGLPKRLTALRLWAADAGWGEFDDTALHFSLDPFQVNEVNVNNLARYISANEQGPVLIIIDTQMQSMAGVNESDAGEMSKMLLLVRNLARAVEGAVCLIHHTGKDASKGSRGSSTQRADFDFQIEVTRVDDTIIWNTTKERDEADSKNIRFKLKVYEDVLQDEDGEWQSSCVAIPETELDEEEKKTLKTIKDKTKKLSKSLQVALKIFNETIKQHGNAGWLDEAKFREAFLAQYTSGTEDPKKAGAAARQAYKRAMDGLQGAGLIRRDGTRIQNRQRD